MVSVAQLVEHQIVALGAMGSSPITHPIDVLDINAQLSSLIIAMVIS